jgi:16S rRNA processing protein RimM
MIETNPPSWDDMVLVGTVARPHGLRGQVAVNATTDFPEERFAAGATLWTKLEGAVTALRVESVRFQSGRPVVGFADRTSIDAVESLAGCELRIPEGELQPLAEGVYYHHQLVGCVVMAGERRVGTVTKVEGGAGGSLLVVQGDRGEVLIPMAAHICVAIDVAARRIDVAPPEGLLELNVPANAGTRR